MAPKPFMQVYTRDWLGHLGLRSVSLAAQGLWANMMFSMHQSEQCGRLLVAGKPVTSAKLARMVGVSEKEVIPLLQELLDAEVCYADGEGDARVLFSRRMVRETGRAEQAVINGRLGGNPRLADKGGDNPTSGAGVGMGVNPPANPQDGNGHKPRSNPGPKGRGKPYDNPARPAPDNPSEPERVGAGLGEGLASGLAEGINPSYFHKDIYNIKPLETKTTREAGGLTPQPDLVFPASGSIERIEPWASAARQLGRNIDLDVLAAGFRKWLGEKGISPDAPGQLKRWVSFVRNHKLRKSA